MSELVGVVSDTFFQFHISDGSSQSPSFDSEIFSVLISLQSSHQPILPAFDFETFFNKLFRPLNRQLAPEAHCFLVTYFESFRMQVPPSGFEVLSLRAVPPISCQLLSSSDIESSELCQSSDTFLQFSVPYCFLFNSLHLPACTYSTEVILTYARKLDPWAQPEGIFVCVDKTQDKFTIAATLRVFHRKLFWNQKEISAGGIGEVATGNTYRRQGLASNLLKACNQPIGVILTLPDCDRVYEGEELPIITSTYVS